IEVAGKLLDYGMEIKNIQKIVNLCENQLYHIKCKKLFRKFEEKIISYGGTFKPRYVYADLSAHPMLSNCNDKVFCMFLDYVSKAESADSSAWFLCMYDYENTGNTDGFAWNEFEKMSLESAESDSEKEEIKKWWECHLPVAMSVKGDYSFLAIDLNNNNIVQGYAPDFEDTEVVAENFEELIKMVISGEFTWL
ncbi:MAG: hypothetical protein K2G14_08375, partial [Ruminococcus sp.]|nr:hypothetical protein [Ruminococcus sp.]